MIEVARSRSAKGFAITGLGHAGATPVCAATTVLLRTAAKVCAERSLVVEGVWDVPGSSLLVAEAAEKDRAWLDAVRTMVFRGIDDLAREHPADVRVTEYKSDDRVVARFNRRKRWLTRKVAVARRTGATPPHSG